MLVTHVSLFYFQEMKNRVKDHTRSSMKNVLCSADYIEAPLGVWGTGELGIFINGNTGTSCTLNGDQGNSRNYFREQGTF